ncbi:uncharacterized protein LOC144121939 isoform X2 [Amblyomma americanum]
MQLNARRRMLIAAKVNASSSHMKKPAARSRQPWAPPVKRHRAERKRGPSEDGYRAKTPSPTETSSSGSRYPRRQRKEINYMEWEENSDEDYPCEENWEEDYLFCDDCGIAHPGDCPKHGPLTHVRDAEVCKDGEVFLVDGPLDRSNCPVHKNRTWCPSAVTGTYTTRHPRPWVPKTETVRPDCNRSFPATHAASSFLHKTTWRSTGGASTRRGHRKGTAAPTAPIRAITKLMSSDIRGPTGASVPSCARCATRASHGKHVSSSTSWSTLGGGRMSAPSAGSASARCLTWLLTAGCSTVWTVLQMGCKPQG